MRTQCISGKIRNSVLVALAILMGCGLAFAELSSRQRALRCRLDCATYSKHMGGSSSPPSQASSVLWGNFLPLVPLLGPSRRKAY